MKTSQIFIISALILSIVFFGVLSLFDLPHSMAEWLISDVVLGIILYMSYLVIAMKQSTSKTELRDQLKTSWGFLIAALIVGGIFFGILFWFDLPSSTMDWVISDIFLGLLLYFTYLVLVVKRRNGASKNTSHRLDKKVTE